MVCSYLSLTTCTLFRYFTGIALEVFPGDLNPDDPNFAPEVRYTELDATGTFSTTIPVDYPAESIGFRLVIQHPVSGEQIVAIRQAEIQAVPVPSATPAAGR